MNSTQRLVAAVVDIEQCGNTACIPLGDLSVGTAQSVNVGVADATENNMVFGWYVAEHSCYWNRKKVGLPRASYA